MWPIRRAAHRAPRCRCRSPGKSWPTRIRSTFASRTPPSGSRRPGTAGATRSRRRRACKAPWNAPKRKNLAVLQSLPFFGGDMAARSIASLTVSFGLVSIPVKLFSATEASRAISFNLLHKACGSRLRQQYFCIKEDVPVQREDMVKGYEFAKDQYVMFTPEELKALEEAGTGTADISEFVPLESVDPVYFDKAYYLAPDKGGAKPYALLTKALRESKRCALGRWAARGKQYIVMIRPIENENGDALVMQQLLYAAEVRKISEIEIPRTDVKDAELKLAQQLIDQQAPD